MRTSRFGRWVALAFVVAAVGLGVMLAGASAVESHSVQQADTMWLAPPLP